MSVEAITRLTGSSTETTVHWYELAAIGAALILEAARMAVTPASPPAAKMIPRCARTQRHFRGRHRRLAAGPGGACSRRRRGFHDGDSVAALLVALIIFVTAVRLIAPNANVLMDRAPVEARVLAERAIAALGADVELDRLRLREQRAGESRRDPPDATSPTSS